MQRAGRQGVTTGWQQSSRVIRTRHCTQTLCSGPAYSSHSTTSGPGLHLRRLSTVIRPRREFVTGQPGVTLADVIHMRVRCEWCVAAQYRTRTMLPVGMIRWE